MDTELKEQFEKIDKRFDNLTSFLQNNMVTKEELNALSGKVTKLEESVNRLTEAVEKLTVAVQNITKEHTVIKHQILIMQDWMRKAAEKIGVEFKL